MMTLFEIRYVNDTGLPRREFFLWSHMYSILINMYSILINMYSILINNISTYNILHIHVCIFYCVSFMVI